MYEDSIDLEVSAERALDRARAVFTGAGLNVAENPDGSLSIKRQSAVSVAQVLRDPYQEPMLALSSGEISVRDGRMELKANLAGLKYFQAIILGLPVFVIAFVAMMFYSNHITAPREMRGATGVILLAILAAVVCIVVTRKIKKDLHRALVMIANWQSS
ncbi:MAG: hypothetical protein ABFD69_07575 [Candidatus Sumerlaeia bacterium]